MGIRVLILPNFKKKMVTILDYPSGDLIRETEGDLVYRGEER